MNRITRRRNVLRCVAAALFTSVIGVAPSYSGTFPEKPVTLVIPYKAGGSTETMARLYSKALAKELGQRVIVKTRPGAGGSVGTTEVAKSPADGYTVLFAASFSLLWPPLTQKVEYDLNSFEYVGQVTEYQNAIVAKSDAPFSTLEELYAEARKKRLTYADQTQMSRRFIEYMAGLEGVKWSGIPTRGGGEMVPFLLGGKIDFAYSGGIHNKYAGKIKVIASMNAGRLIASPDVPSVSEKYGISMPSHALLAVPKGTPKDVVAILEKAVGAATKDPAFIDIVTNKLKFPVKFVGSEALTADIAKTVKGMKTVIEKTK